ncbi:MAG: hypothetical protein D6689_19145 [Deltaproteobacteria bacterium]|nr:MAG: hypothetical protein D6689_19145 [Deltaproteobacteria bacterium]
MLGDEFAGVVAATLAASRGLRVLLASTGDLPDAYEVGPYRLPTRPLALAGLASPAAARVIGELNFGHLLKRRMRDHAPAFQLIAPDARLDVTGDDDALAAELARDAPAAADAALAVARAARDVSAHLDPLLGQSIAFPPVKFFDRREVARFDEPLAAAGAAVDAAAAAAPIARALAAAPAAFGTCLDPATGSPVAAGRALDQWRRGVPHLPGGRAALRTIFLDKFDSHGGERRAVEPEAILVSWGKATGVRLRDGEEIGAEHVVCAMPVARVRELLAKPPRRLEPIAGALRPAAYRYTLNLVVAEAGIPEGMAATALVVADPARPPVGDNALAVFVSEPDDEARAVVTVEALWPCPAGTTAPPDDGALADLRVRVRERLEDVMPFSSGHVLAAHSPNEIADPERIAARASLAEPLAPAPVWRVDGALLLGVAAAPYPLGVKRLTLASTQVLPGLGLEGELQAGWCAALIACGGAKKRDGLAVGAS